MPLINTLRAEILKLKGSSTWMLCLVMAALIPVLFLFIFEAESPEELNVLKNNPWPMYLRRGWVGIGFMILPLYITLSATLIPQIEYRNNTWKQVLTSPQHKLSIFASKFILLHLLILVFICAYIVFVLASGMLQDVIHPGYGFMKKAPHWNMVLPQLVNVFLTCTPLSAMLFWLGMRSRSFVFPIAFSLLIYFFGLTNAFEFKLIDPKYFPFTLPMVILSDKYAIDIPFVIGSAVGYTLIFFALGYADFARKEYKG